MKQYTNSKGKSLPKVICAVVDFESNRLGSENDSNLLEDAFEFGMSNIFDNRLGSENDSNLLEDAFELGMSNILDGTNYHSWKEIDAGRYEDFYSIFPTCKNSRGQELPEDIQVEIVEERLRQGLDKPHLFLGFIFRDALKGSDYWLNIWESDYTNTELPTKSDDTFTQGETVEVSDYKEQWYKKEYVSTYKGLFITFDSKNNGVGYWKYCRKPILELTLPELLTIAEEVKGTKVKLKS